MEKFVLKTKNGEIINTVQAFDFVNAAKLFAEGKNISITDLLKIYIVEEASK
jgi:hypothetical protein